LPSIVAVESTTQDFTASEDEWGFEGFIEKADLKKRLPGYSRALLVNDILRVSVYLRVYHKQEAVDDDGDSNYEDVEGEEEEEAAVDQQIAPHGRSPDGYLGLADDVTALKDEYGETPQTAIIQHYTRLLCDSIDKRLKNTDDEGIVDALFMGMCRTTTQCLNVNYSSSRSEPFYDLSVNIDQVSTVQDAVDLYCTPVSLKDGNQYRTEAHGYQDAVRKVLFEKLPPVLHIHLNRFEYEVGSGLLTKSSRRTKYSMHLNLAHLLTSNAERENSWPYSLYGVFLHSGDVNSGRYYSLVRPRIADEWFCYEDDLVYPVSPEFVLDETDEIGDNVGRDDYRVFNHQGTSRFENAYMLVYIRTSMLTQVFGFESSLPRPALPSAISAVPQATASSSLVQPGSEPLIVPVYIVNDNQTTYHQGFDLCNHPNIGGLTGNSLISLYVPLMTTTAALRTLAATEMVRQPDVFRFWCMTPRINRTLRCEFPMAWSSTTTIKALLRDHGTASNTLYLYCEMREASDPVYFSWPSLPQGVIMLHLKFYDPEKGKMVGLGHIYVNTKLSIQTILPILCQKAKLRKKTDLVLYEEVKPSMILDLSAYQSFEKAELQTGDIICFQVKPSGSGRDVVPRGNPQTIPAFFAHLANSLGL
ncbi:ubiquitin-specific protease ubp15, partial [Linderina macrospora]